MSFVILCGYHKFLVTNLTLVVFSLLKAEVDALENERKRENDNGRDVRTGDGNE